MQQRLTALLTARWRIALRVLALVCFVSGQCEPSTADDAADRNRAEIRLGRRLFEDGRFSTTAGDFVTSCRDCHLSSESPEGLRAFTDFLSRSWQPWRSQDPTRDTLRNAPTLFDTGDLSRLHYDGEFSSLEELVSGTLTGRPMGWLPGEQQQAAEWIRDIILGGDANKPETGYSQELLRVYEVDVESLPPAAIVELVSGAIASYVRTLRSPRNSPYDEFVAVNGLDAGPSAGQTTEGFASRQLARVAVLEESERLQLPRGFGPDALEGWKRCHNTAGANCVACHVPPSFSDGRFHNIGVSQREYDEIHGEGTFAALPIPGADAAVRPDDRFRSSPSLERPGAADLGYWNFVDLDGSPERRLGESQAAFLNRMVATFKTPTLRNLTYSQPYFHNGRIGSLASTVAELRELNVLAQSGRIRAVAEEFAASEISGDDVPYLVEFLQALNDDLGPEFAGR